MFAPTPPMTFDPARGHTGATPTGPVLQKTPDLGTQTVESVLTVTCLKRSSVLCGRCFCPLAAHSLWKQSVLNGCLSYRPLIFGPQGDHLRQI
jgi:hypothetical protein